MKKFLKSIDKKIFPDIYSGRDSIEELLKKEVLSSKIDSFLDVGCGKTLSSPLKNIAPKLKHTVGIDLFEPSIDFNLESPIYNEYIVMDALKIDNYFEEKSFDLVIATDLIEHLTKEEGIKFLEKAEKIARKKIIIFTPNGFINQDPYEDNVYQIHKSGFTVKDFRQLGFQKIYGANGVKFLRGEGAVIKFKPENLWFRISLLSSPIAVKLPGLAFQLIAVKTL